MKKERAKKLTKEELKNYYVYLTDQIGEKTVTTRELYQIVRDTDTHFGHVCSENGHEAHMANKYLEILGDSISSIEDTESKKLKTKTPRIYSLDDTVTKIKEKIGAYYNIPVKEEKPEEKEKVEEPKEEEVVTVPIIEEVRVPRKYTRTKPTRKTVENIYKTLKICYSAGGIGTPFHNLKRIIGKSVTVTEFEGWLRTLESFGVHIIWKINKEKGETNLRFYNIKTTMLSLNKKAIEWFGKSLGAEEEFGIKPTPSPSPIPTPKTEKKEDNNKTIFLIGALIRNNGWKALDIDDLCAGLRGFGEDSWKTAVLKIIEGTHELRLVRGGAAVTFEGGEKDWEEFKNKYLTPKISVLARIRIKPENLRELGIEYKIESAITEEDFIYQISYRPDSRVDFRRLVKLYMKFKGTDKFLGSMTDELVTKIEEQIKDDMRMIEEADKLYQIEK